MRILLSLLLLSFSVGCQSPAAKKERLEEKKTVKVTQLETNRVAQVVRGAGMADAALHAVLRNPNPTLYDDVARMTLETSILAFTAADVMPPSYEILRYRKMVDDLLSTNSALQAQASNTLARAQSEIGAAERREQTLTGELAKLQARLDVVNSENAALASTWVGLKRIFWWGVWLAGGLFVLRVVATVVPPPYNSVGFIVDYLVGGVVRMALGVFSHAKDTAKVVAADAHQLTATTLKQVITALETAKRDNPELKTTLRPYLLDETSKEATRPVIEQLKSGIS